MPLCETLYNLTVELLRETWSTYTFEMALIGNGLVRQRWEWANQADAPRA